MRVCGIVSEYNPFHAGHAHQCRVIRSQTDGCTLVAVMSGNYVQRGDLAIWEKYDRAALAVRSGGPDLILELSLPHALGSAERFASGGISQLLATGCLTHLSFGSECGDAAQLHAAAALLDSAEFSALRQQAMQTGLGYAAACQAAMHTLDPALEPLLAAPNDTLGLQYLRALGTAPVELLPVLRRGAGHDEHPSDGVPSASWLRAQMAVGRDVSCYFSEDISRYSMHCIADREREILSYLRRFSVSDWASLPDISEGLEHRLYEAARNCASLDALADAVSSRRYPRARIRRLVMCAWLGITAELAALPPQYLRVLAFNDKGRDLLKQMKKTASLPIITKPLAGRDLSGDAAKLFALDTLADDLYAFPAPAGEGLRRTPYYHR